MLVRRIADAFIPSGVRRYFSSLHSFSSQLLTVVIEEYERPEFNQLFQAADSYWGTLVTSSVIRDREGEDETAIEKDHEILDVFRNVQVRWKLVFTEAEHGNTTIQSGRRRTYELTFHKEHKDTVLNLYFPYVLEQEKAIKEGRKVQKFFLSSASRRSRLWQLDNTFEHTTTFKTLAMDTKLKKTVLDDLNTFMGAQEMYRSIGKAWNRRYLICGSPGTGKSSMIAAMANHLHYDIYELDQTDIHIYYLMHQEVPSKSIFVFKDTDCDVELQDQEYVDGTESCGKNKRMMSLFLKATDGLWSSCTSERIFVYMANNKTMLDPALLGRTDIHINMSYCTISTFKQLAFQYLAVKHHKLFKEIEGLVEDVEVTPKEILQEMLKSNDIEVSFQGLVKFLHNKKLKSDETTEADRIIARSEELASILEMEMETAQG